MHVHNNFSIDYQAYNSAIRNWNTECKLLFALSAIITVIVSENILVSLYTFIFMGIVNIYIAKLSVKEYLHAIRIPALFILAGSIAAGTGVSKEVQGICCLDIGFAYLYVTKESLKEMLDIVLKAFGAVSAMYLVTLSTPAGEIVTAFKKLHFPGIFIELMYLVYRYIFILFDEVHKMRNAGMARLGYSSFTASCKSFSMMLGNLLIVSMRNSRVYYDAMEARCYNGCLEFYTEKRKCTKLQLSVIVLYFILLIVFVYFCSFFYNTGGN